MVTIDDGRLAFRGEFRPYRSGGVRRFAELRNPQQIQLFAGTFGPLGFEDELHLVERWRKEAGDIRAALKVWDALVSGDATGRLREHVSIARMVAVSPCRGTPLGVQEAAVSQFMLLTLAV